MACGPDSVCTATLSSPQCCPWVSLTRMVHAWPVPHAGSQMHSPHSALLSWSGHWHLHWHLLSLLQDISLMWYLLQKVQGMICIQYPFFPVLDVICMHCSCRLARAGTRSGMREGRGRGLWVPCLPDVAITLATLGAHCMQHPFQHPCHHLQLTSWTCQNVHHMF